jgi:hypothetical protein
MLDWAEKFKAAFAQRLKDIALPEPVSVEGEGASANVEQLRRSIAMLQPGSLAT